MSKADCTNKLIPSRRTVLASAVALSAFTVPAIAASKTTPAAFDGVYDRAQSLVQALRERHVCDGWKIDETHVAEFLDYARSFPAGAHDPIPENVLELIFDHGQSLDWLFLGDVVVHICKCAAHSPRAASLAGQRQDQFAPDFDAVQS
jgi:hypothetical protein